MQKNKNDLILIYTTTFRASSEYNSAISYILIDDLFFRLACAFLLCGILETYSIFAAFSRFNRYKNTPLFSFRGIRSSNIALTYEMSYRRKCLIHSSMCVVIILIMNSHRHLQFNMGSFFLNRRSFLAIHDVISMLYVSYSCSSVCCAITFMY